jgi:DNA-binding CsgD family transcriptional regulator
MVQNNSRFITEAATKLNDQPFDGRNLSDIHKFPLNSKQCLYIVDWQDSTIPYQKHIKEILGYEKNEFTLHTIMSVVHPEDFYLIKKITQMAVNHMLNYTLDEKSSQVATLNLSYRLRKKDGSYVKILRQSTLFETTKAGLMKSNLSLITDISFIDTSDTINWEFIAPKIEQEIFRNLIYIEFDNFFTNREVDVLKLISENYQTKNIAQKLFISEHTAYSHRKNILKKSNCHNARQLIEFCKRIGVL